MRGTTKARGRPVRDSAAALTREKIVKAAVQIVDKDGLAALSMRHLGKLLGVDAMAIYYHLPNKAALYDAIVEAVMAEVDPPAPDARASAIEQLKQMALSYRDALLAHPNALPVVATRPVRSPASLRPIERMLAAIASLGFTAQESIAFVDVCVHFIMGWAQTCAAHLQGSEEASSDRPAAVEFELGINTILAGLMASAEGRTSPGRAVRAQPAPWTPDAD